MMVRDPNQKDVSGPLTPEEEIWALFRELETSSDEKEKAAARERIWRVAERSPALHAGDAQKQTGPHIMRAEKLPE